MVVSVQPKLSLIIAAPPEAIVVGSNAQAELLEAVRADIAASLGVKPSDMIVDNIGSARRLMHRRLEDTVQLRFDLQFVDNDAHNHVVAITAQLADPDSPLLSSNTTSQLLVDQIPEIAFVCPIGKIRTNGELLCRKCPVPKYASDSVNCLDCPINQIPTARGDACQCDNGYYSAEKDQLMCLDDEYDAVLVANEIALRGGVKECLAVRHAQFVPLESLPLFVAESAMSCFIRRAPSGCIPLRWSTCASEYHVERCPTNELHLCGDGYDGTCV